MQDGKFLRGSLRVKGDAGEISLRFLLQAGQDDQMERCGVRSLTRHPAPSDTQGEDSCETDLARFLLQRGVADPTRTTPKPRPRGLREG